MLDAVCERLLAILGQPAQAPARPEAPACGVLARVLCALAALRPRHPRLFPTLVSALSAALAAEWRAGGLPQARVPDFVDVAVALSSLASPDALLPACLPMLVSLWTALTSWMQRVCDGEAHVRRGGGTMARSDARRLAQAAEQLNSGVAGRRSVFVLPACAQSVLCAGLASHRVLPPS